MKTKQLYFVLTLFLAGKFMSQIPVLNSRPSNASKVIYLDFDGQVVTGTLWNNGNTVNAVASTASQNSIKQIWQRVSEDYRPFDVNVTTDSMRFNNASPSSRIRVVFTGTSSWYGSAGGVAFLGSFTWGGYPGTPCWIFENQLNYSTKSMAEAAAHEVGHTLSLYHQSTYNTSCTKTNEYNPGTGNGVTSWAPIMGVGYNRNVTIWHNGTNANGCSVFQNDHSGGSPGITGGSFLNYLPDDVGNTLSSAKILNLNTTSLSDSGIITTPGDVDLFRFEICNSRYISINAKPWALDTNSNSYAGANLDIKLKLYNSSGGLLLADTSYTKLNGLIGTTLSAGIYYFGIDGGASNNYSDYGSLGKYYVSIKALNPPQLANTIVTPTSLCAGQIAALNASSNGTPTIWNWNVSGPSAGSFTVQNPNFNFSNAGIYTITLLATSSSSLSCPVTKTIEVGNSPSLTVTGAGSPVCLPYGATLTASGANSYTWLPGNYSGSVLAVFPTTNTVYVLNANNGLCYNTSTVNVTIGAAVALSLSVSSNTICSGSSATISASGGISYSINPGNYTTSSAVVSPTYNTNYTITAYNGTCYKTAYQLVSVEQPFGVTATASELYVCPGQTLMLYGSGASTYTFYPGGLVGSVVMVSPTVTTTYTMMASSANNCPRDTTILITTIFCDMTGLTEGGTVSAARVYPVPASGNLMVEYENGFTELELTNAEGKTVFSYKTKDGNEKSLSVPLLEINPGIYFLKLKTEGAMLIRKISVE